MSSVVESLTAGLEHLRAGRLAEAESLYRQVLAREPRNADALHLLGMTSHALGRHEAAVELIERAIGQAPAVAAFHNNLGTVLQAQNRHREAIERFQHALRLEPGYAEAHINLGNSLQALRRFEEALGHYREALERKPGSPEAHNNLANALAGLGRFEEAIAGYREALRLRPDYAEALVNLASSLHKQERLEEAAECCRRALQLRPDMAEAHSNLAGVLAAQQKYEEAEAHCRRALELKPDLAEAHANLSLIRLDQKRPEEAVGPARRACELKPDLVEAVSNLGDAYAKLGRLAAAMPLYRQALELKPNSAELHNKLGFGYQRMGERAAAKACFEEALRRKPELPEAHLNRSMAWLLEGDFERGWSEYEWRWKNKDFARWRFQRPRWDGAPLAGRTIVLHAEQGLGDTLQFVRYAPLVKARGGRVVVECQSRLVPLVATVAGIDEAVPAGLPLPEHDVQAPLLSLPYIFGTRLETIPGEVPYLKVDPARLEKWRERLSGERRLKVGLAWAGNPRHESDCNRSLRLAQLATLARAEGVAWFSLQRGAGREQLAQPPVGMEIMDLEHPDGDVLDSAAAILNLDLIITIDSMVAHLAGALGRPVWVLLAAAPDWRWLLGRENSPWYPTARLFRQERLGDWDTVLARVAEALKDVRRG